MQFFNLLACGSLLCASTVTSRVPTSNHDLALDRRQSATNNTTATININQDPTGLLNATARSLIYTYPLAIFSSWAGGVLRNYSVNTIFHQRNLASPGDPGVIKPNVDTLYSRVALDLSEVDVVLTVPSITDGRYWVFPVYDPFGNNQAEIGIVNGNKAGDYLIRRSDDVFQPPGYSNNTSTFNSSAYQGVINLPGSYATMLIRILLLQNTTEDLHAVHIYQNASRLTNIRRPGPLQANTNPAPSLQSLALNNSLLGIQTPSQQLEFAARIIPHTQPQIYSERYRIASILASAGLYNNHYHPSPTLNLTLAAVIANASITADVQDPAHIRPQGNDWQLSIPSYQGNFRTNYGSAAYVALAGYQQQTTLQTLYPGYQSLGFTSSFTLSPQTALLVTFSGKPRLADSGFWSITVYGADQYLIPNPLNRFEVGDRTFSLTYPDGEPVYGPNANASRDGPFQILVQPTKYPPGGDWTNNWLPTNETFSWIARWYVPLPAMTNGSYVYPKVETVNMFTT